MQIAYNLIDIFHLQCKRLLAFVVSVDNLACLYLFQSKQEPFSCLRIDHNLLYLSTL